MISLIFGTYYILKNKYRHTSLVAYSSEPITSNAKKIKNINVLSLDGGGMRGYMQLLILQEIEKRCKKNLTETFDYFIGTSIGGLNSVFISEFVNVDVAIEFMEKDAAKMFTKSGAFNFLSENMYSNVGLKKILEEKLGSKKLKDSNKKLLIMTSNDLAKPKDPKLLLTSWGSGCDLNLSDAVLSTTACPMIFPPYRVNIDGTEHTLKDGTLIANDPSYFGYKEILKHLKDTFSNNSENDFKIKLLSIGTGLFSKGKKDISVANIIDLILKLKINEAKTLIALAFMDNSCLLSTFRSISDGELVREDMEKKSKGSIYWRLDPDLDEMIMMDDYSKKNMLKMKNLVQKFIIANDKLLDDICINLLQVSI
ncbi:MAG: patatin-like phospholipase family protein [Oligoflexia bacterium]|nr:patatin-like phospholipase family protein [Oligoflexia bacterium]